MSMYYNEMSDVPGMPDKDEDKLYAMQSGYAMGCFCFLVAFFISLYASIYYTPLFCSGSNLEKECLSNPDVLNGSSA